MKINLIFCVFFLGIIQFASAQNISSEYLVRSTTGSAGSSENISSNNQTYVVQQSIGQASAIGTFYTSNYILRQGFIQPGISHPVFPIKPSPSSSLALSLSVAIYPNPFTETVTLSFSEKIDDTIEVVLFDLAGRLVFSQNYKANQKLRVLFPNLPLATYIMKVTANNQHFVKKLLKNSL